MASRFRVCARVAVAALIAASLAPATTVAQDARDNGATANAATAPSTVPGANATQPVAVPSRSDTPMEAFGKLNRRHADYLTYDDVQALPGFAGAFAQADQNGDGRLNAAEFNTAWSIYTGATR